MSTAATPAAVRPPPRLQREQIALIGTLPYAALIAARDDGRDISPSLAALIGGSARLGFTLKHYFRVVSAPLDFWLAAILRRDWALADPNHSQW
jgi:hypothetical protein